MKKIFLIIVILACINTMIQAQQVFASTIKLGPFYLEMKQKEVESTILRKFTNKELQKSNESYNNNIKVTLNGVIFELGFSEMYNEDTLAPKKYYLTRAKCGDSRIKTKSGIAIGMDKFQILKILDTQKLTYTFSKFSSYDNDGKPNGGFGEGLTIYDEKASRSLHIEFKNGKASVFYLSYGDEGC
jgi:hypothetical protein